MVKPLYNLPAIHGALLSTVTVFFSFAPCLMDCSSISRGGPPDEDFPVEGAIIGGGGGPGGGGGGGIVNHLAQIIRHKYLIY